MRFQVQNSFWHAWITAANRRPDGSVILAAAKLPVLHGAIVAHCDALDGVKDGLIGDPRACRPDPAWSACVPGASETTTCLTADEWAAARRLYSGPSDAAGHRFLPGGAQPGSELQWRFGGGPGGSMIATMSKVVYQEPTVAEADPASFPFTTAQVARVSALHPLNDATDPDLARFARHGGRLIMYHGWSDTSIAPLISIAYRQAVERTMGAGTTASFLRLFMIPGMGHCGGGDGFPQIDTLTPLIEWVEGGHAPEMIVADRVDDGGRSSGGPDGRGGGPGARRAPAPYAPLSRPAVASRPVYAYPTSARYDGRGDQAVAASYAPVVTLDPTLSWYGDQLLAPAFQRVYKVRDGKLTTR